MRRVGGLAAALLVTAAVLAVVPASPARAEGTGTWCSALAYLLGDAPRNSVTVTVSCSATVRELRISIPWARRVTAATARTASRRRACTTAAGATAVCRIRLPAGAGLAITAIASPAPKVGRTVVFGATFANGSKATLRLTITGPPGEDG